MYFYLELKCDSSLNVISFIPFAIYIQLLWAIFFILFQFGKRRHTRKLSLATVFLVFVVAFLRDGD